MINQHELKSLAPRRGGVVGHEDLIHTERQGGRADERQPYNGEATAGWSRAFACECRRGGVAVSETKLQQHQVVAVHDFEAATMGEKGFDFVAG